MITLGGISKYYQVGGGGVPIVVSAVSIAGTEVVNQTLTVSYTITGTPTVITRRWYRGATLISTSTSSDTYVLTQAEAGNTSNITCNVDADGVSNATSNTIAQILDADAAAYLISSDNAAFTSGINTLTISWKSNGLWAKTKRLYPFRGGSDAKAKWDLKTNVAGVFSGAFTHTADGPIPNGVNAYFDPNINANTLTANDNACGFDSITNNAISVDFDMGAGANNSGSENVAIFTRRTGNSSGYDSGTFPNGRVSTTTTDSKALFIGSIIANNDRKYYRNGTQIATSATVYSQVLPNAKIMFFAFNAQTTGLMFYGSKGCCLGFICDGLTATDIANIQTIRNQYKIDCGIS